MVCLELRSNKTYDHDRFDGHDVKTMRGIEWSISYLSVLFCKVNGYVGKKD